MKSSFGVDKLRSKNCISSVILADLTTPEGEALLMSWLHMPNIVGVLLAPPCGSTSRARQIPLKRKWVSRNCGPRPVHSDEFLNGLQHLTARKKSRLIANQLYHPTSKIVRWCVDVGCIVVVENPQYSLFCGQQPFGPKLLTFACIPSFTHVSTVV